jgi:hypothetical protein
LSSFFASHSAVTFAGAIAFDVVISVISSVAGQPVLACMPSVADVPAVADFLLLLVFQLCWWHCCCEHHDCLRLYYTALLSSLIIMFSEFFTVADVSAIADTIPIALVVFALATLHLREGNLFYI